MQTQLCLYFSQLGEPVAWYSRTDKTAGCCHLDELRKQFPGSPAVDIIAPSEPILLTQVQLPDTNTAKQLEAAPYALEENLADDPQHCHFALGPDTEGGPRPVAVINKALLEKWCEAFEQSGFVPTSIIPESLCLPWEHGTWTILHLHSNKILIRTDEYAGIALTLEELPDWLALASPAHLELYAADGNCDPMASLLEKTSIAYNASPEPFNLIDSARINWPALNLLQGAYAPKQQRKQSDKLWRLAGVLTLAWVGLSVGGNLLQYAYFKHKKTQLTQSIRQHYFKVFPHASAVVNPKLRFERLLHGQNKTQLRNDFLPLMNQLSSAWRANQPLHLRTLNYQTGKLQLTLEADDFSAIGAFRKAASPLRITQSQAKRTGQTVQVTLDVGA